MRSVSFDAVSAREVLYRNLRDFFSSQKIVEVHTAAFPFSLSTHQTSVFQISKQSRDEAIDRRHCKKFSVLQWIQPDWTNQTVLAALDQLLMAVFSGDFEPERRTFRQAFIQRLGFDPEEIALLDLKQEAKRLGLNAKLGEDRLAWLKLMFVHFIEPTLGIDNPLYLIGLPYQWRNAEFDGEVVKHSSVDVFIDGIKVGSVLSQTHHSVDEVQTQFPLLNVIFGLDRLLMIILETRQIEKVVSIV